MKCSRLVSSPLFSSPSSQPARCEVLSGWKDIAQYLGMGVRTVQRYERELGLQVRRPAAKSRGSVLAIKIELDAWVAAAPMRDAYTSTNSVPPSLSERDELRKGLTEMRSLREKMRQSRCEFHAAFSDLMNEIRLMCNGGPLLDGTTIPLSLDYILSIEQRGGSDHEREQVLESSRESICRSQELIEQTERLLKCSHTADPLARLK